MRFFSSNVNLDKNKHFCVTPSDCSNIRDIERKRITKYTGCFTIFALTCSEDKDESESQGIVGSEMPSAGATLKEIKEKEQK